MTERHGGNMRKILQETRRESGDILDFSANINPLGPPEDFRAVIGRQIDNLVHYPDPDCADLTAAFAARHHIAGEEIVVGNGSTELLYLLPGILQKRRAVIPVPAYVDYQRAANLAGRDVKLLLLNEENGFALDAAALDAELTKDDILFLGRPNNPTGSMPSSSQIRALAARHPETVFLIDEAFADFAPATETMIAPDRAKNIIILKSLTKLYAMPGLRLGVVVAAPELAKQLQGRMPPWSVNTLAQAAGTAALQNAAYIEKTRRFINEKREELRTALAHLPGLKVYPGEANFLLIRSELPTLDAIEISRRLLACGIAIRVCDNFTGLDRRFFRVAVRTQRENGLLVAALQKALGVVEKRAATKKTPALMLQGTGSNAGKSVLAAAFCRILLQDGFRVAPFKAQNMSLNSFVSVRTELAPEKTLKLSTARHLPSGCPVRGYEIHHGLTQGGGLMPLIIRENGENIGVGAENGLCWGTYLHGIFDDDRFRRWFIDSLRTRKALEPLGKIVAVYDLEPAFDRLAQTVRQAVKMDEIYKIMGL